MNNLRPTTTIDFFGMYLAHDACMRDLIRLSAAVAENRLAEPAVRIGWATFRRQLDRHHSTEDAALWPLVRAAATDPADLAILEDMETEHEGIEELLAKVESAISGSTGGPGLRSDVDALAAALDTHFTHEEQMALPLIDRTVGGPGWAAFGAEMRKRNGLRAVTEYLPWALDDAPADAQAKMLGFLPTPIRFLYRYVLEPGYLRRRRGWL
ncbi:hemerythrin domain-containing protein [Nocardia sp. NBC_01503]|uniref:hemerythrin domain-containing protein n=1 Tax=Nocardia sp. NBC_01503 TaxID=2975997 RepID=UPI002E7B5215|nr:hemerythrin domain-containing protein [Nocardia sp. NBC_01503]WTL35721.1 hemerythrin domain-containing protein [Nocardia sp. NBC_01503]